MLTEKAMELANLALAGIVFVQLVPGQQFSTRATVLGVVAFFLLHGVAFYIAQRGGEE